MSDGDLNSVSGSIATGAGWPSQVTALTTSSNGRIVSPADLVPGGNAVLWNAGIFCNFHPTVGNFMQSSLSAYFNRYTMYRVRRIRVYLTYNPPNRVIGHGGLPPDMPGTNVDLVVTLSSKRGPPIPAVPWASASGNLVTGETPHWMLVSDPGAGRTVFRRRLLDNTGPKTFKFYYKPYIDTVSYETNTPINYATSAGPAFQFMNMVNGSDSLESPKVIPQIRAARKPCPWLPTWQNMNTSNGGGFATTENDDIRMHGLTISLGPDTWDNVSIQFSMRVVADIEFKHLRAQQNVDQSGSAFGYKWYNREMGS